MGEVSFAFIERTQGVEAAQAAEDDLRRLVDAYEQYCAADNAFTGGLYGEQTDPENTPPDMFEQRVYRIAGRISVVAVIDGIPTVEHRDYWPAPELPADDRVYIRAYYWGKPKRDRI